MHYVLIVLALIAVLWFGGPVLIRLLLARRDYAASAAALDRDGAHTMFENHIRQMALSIAMPEHFFSGKRDAAAAAAAMMRILELENEYRPPEEVRAFVSDLAKRRADEMIKDDRYPVAFDDMWSL